VAAALLGAAVYALLPMAWAAHPAARALVAWNGTALLYLLLVLHLTLSDDAAAMRRRALRQSDGRIAVLVLVVLAAAAVLLAVGSQLASVKDMQGTQRTLHVGLAAVTVVSSWSFTQVLFALHYAHDFYLARLRHQDDPLIFPGTPDPGYGDFIYFACVIGTSGQTADVSFNGPGLRRVGTVHCVLAFFFNATLLALTINIAAGLL
jgi:uncharacterized membrane protein